MNDMPIPDRPGSRPAAQETRRTRWVFSGARLALTTDPGRPDFQTTLPAPSRAACPERALSSVRQHERGIDLPKPVGSPHGSPHARASAPPVCVHAAEFRHFCHDAGAHVATGAS